MRHRSAHSRHLENVNTGYMPSDAELLVAARKDVDAFATFYERHVHTMLRYFARRTRDPDLAADMTAEVFAQALRSVASYKPRRAPAVTWLYAIARNVFARTLRQGYTDDRALRKLALEPPPLDEEERRGLIELARHPNEGELLGLLRTLPLDQRAAVLARVVDEREYEDIACEQDCSQAVVRKRVSRGLDALKRQMDLTTILPEDFA